MNFTKIISISVLIVLIGTQCYGAAPLTKEELTKRFVAHIDTMLNKMHEKYMLQFDDEARKIERLPVLTNQERASVRDGVRFFLMPQEEVELTEQMNRKMDDFGMTLEEKQDVISAVMCQRRESFWSEYIKDNPRMKEVFILRRQNTR